MNMKKNRIPAFLLSVLIAFAMTFTTGATAQNAYAEDSENEYIIIIESDEGACPGDTYELNATVKKGGEPVDIVKEGMILRWNLGDWDTGDIAKYVIPDDDGNIVRVGDNTTTAKIVFREAPEEEVNTFFGLEVALWKGDTHIQSEWTEFKFATSFNEPSYIFEGGEPDPYLVTGETQYVQVNVTHHQSGGKPAPLEATYDWSVDNNGVKILDEDGEAVTTRVSGKNLKFTFSRVDSSKDTEAHLIITDEEGNEEIDNIYFEFYAVSNNLADYQIEFNGDAENSLVFVDGKDLPIEENSEVCKITVVSGSGDGNVLTNDEYDLKIKKVLGYNETTWDPVTKDVNFPLNVDPAGSSDINGYRTDGTALYYITAVAKSGSPYVGQTSDDTGILYLIDRKTITFPATYGGFSEKYYNDNQSRYEAKKGKKLTPFLTSVEDTSKNLTLNKDYSVRYINKKTKKVYSSFPTKLGSYTVVFSGISPYYGQQEGIDLLIGKKNPIKAKGKTIICKTKMKKGKTKKTKSFKASKAVRVTKAKGVVSYSKVKGNKNITVSDSGKIKVKKGTKKGTYKIKVKVTAQGTSSYIAGSKTVTVKVKVRK